MSFTPKEVILGATLPLENGSTVTFSIAGHVEAERDCDDAVVIFCRKLLKYTNCATDDDRLTVRQVVASITSTPLDKCRTSERLPLRPRTRNLRRSRHLWLPRPRGWSGPYSGGASGGGRRTVHQAAHGCTRSRAECTADPGSLRAAAAAAPPEGFSLCAECGEAVPANQAKLSQLFQGKTLCKQCMEVP